MGVRLAHREAEGRARARQPQKLRRFRRRGLGYRLSCPGVPVPQLGIGLGVVAQGHAEGGAGARDVQQLVESRPGGARGDRPESPVVDLDEVGDRGAGQRSHHGTEGDAGARDLTEGGGRPTGDRRRRHRRPHLAVPHQHHAGRGERRSGVAHRQAEGGGHAGDALKGGVRGARRKCLERPGGAIPSLDHRVGRFRSIVGPHRHAECCTDARHIRKVVRARGRIEAGHQRPGARRCPRMGDRW